MVTRGGVASVLVHTGVLAVVALARGPAATKARPVKPPAIDPPVLVSTTGSAPSGARAGVRVIPAPRGAGLDGPDIHVAVPGRPWNRRPGGCDSACVRRLAELPAAPAALRAEGTTDPELERPVLPEYPAVLIGLGVSGRATIEFTVGADGLLAPGSASVVTADDPRFARSAIAAVLTERFRPARRGGAAVAMRVRQTFVFSVR